MPLVDLDLLRSIYEAHNEAGAEFPDLLARDFLDEDVEFVEFPAAPGAATHRGRDAVAALFRERFEAGAMRVEDLELTALDDRMALAAFRARMRGSGSGAETAMRIWNLVTLEGSRIARLEEFSDEAAALDAARRRSGPAAAR
jgi:ketosteroid isomerase-like protein